MIRRAAVARLEGACSGRERGNLAVHRRDEESHAVVLRLHAELEATVSKAA